MVTPITTRTHPLSSFLSALWSRASSSQFPQHYVGLDLGASSMKLVVVEQDAAGSRVVRHLIQELPHSEDTQTIDRGGWLQAALKDVGATEVTLAMGGPDVVMRRLKVPLMPLHELPEAVKWQIKDDLPFPVQEALLDVAVVGEVWDKDIKKLDVLVAAAAKERVLQQMALVEQAGARVRRVIPTAAAIATTLQHASADHAKRSVAVMEMGASHTHVVILKDGLPRLTRELAIGSSHLTQALVGVAVSSSAGQTLDVAKAEAIKRQYGLLAEGAPGTTEEGLSLEQLSAMMRSVLNALTTELARLLDFYRANLDDAGVEYVLLCGGGALLKQLPAYLSEGLGLRVDAYHPSPALAEPKPASFHEESVRLVVALGAALAGDHGLNLKPREPQRAFSEVVAQQIWTVGSKVLAIGGLIFICGAGLSAAYTSVQLHVLHQQWQRAEPAYQHAMAMMAQQQRLQSVLVAVQAFQDRQPLWDGLFKELGRLAPTAVELTELTATQPESALTRGSLELHLKGMVTGAGSQGSLTKFLEALEESPFFRAPRLVNSQTSMGASAMTTFEIACEVE